MLLVGLTATKNRSRVHIQCFSKLIPPKSLIRGSVFLPLFTTWLYQVDWLVFIAQGRIKFESAIRFSGWARIACANSFSSKPWFAVRVVKNLTFCLKCWVDGAILLLGMNAHFELVIHSPDRHACSTKEILLPMLWTICLFVPQLFCRMLFVSGIIDILGCRKQQNLIWMPTFIRFS